MRIGTLSSRVNYAQLDGITDTSGSSSYRFTGRQAKAIQAWNWDIGTIFLEPRIGPCFASDLLVSIARSDSFTDTIGKRKAYENAFPVPVTDGDRDANVEAAVKPVFLFCHMARRRRFQAKMVCNNGLDPVLPGMKVTEELDLLFVVPQLVNDINLLLPSSRVGDLLIPK